LRRAARSLGRFESREIGGIDLDVNFLPRLGRNGLRRADGSPGGRRA